MALYSRSIMENAKPNLITRSIIKLRLSGAAQRYSSNEYKAIFETVVIGTFALVAILAVLLFYSYWVLNNTQVLGRIFICAAALLYLSVTYSAWAKEHHMAASRLIIILYYTVAVLVMFGWGVDTTFSQLMLAITIILTGVLLGARAVIIMTALSIVAMFAVQFAVSSGSAPWFNEGILPTKFGDVIGYSALIGVLGLISALFDIRTQQLHIEEQQANELLIRQKGTLEKKVRIHSEQVEYLQLEKTEQLYKFAEVGQLSTLLLHDISNQLAILNIDLADLKRHSSQGSTKHIEESLVYIEDAVKQASRHLQLTEGAKNFDVLKCIESSTKLPLYREYENSIIITAPKKQRVLLYGEPLRLSHILFILIRNAFESYSSTTPKDKRMVFITLEASDDTMIIRIKDHGRGISEEAQKQLFNPVRSSKKGGLGIGLFLAKEITESHFNGTLRLNKNVEHTEFILTIPLHTSK